MVHGCGEGKHPGRDGNVVGSRPLREPIQVATDLAGCRASCRTERRVSQMEALSLRWLHPFERAATSALRRGDQRAE
eukprot:96345-Pleurochrysis_carterae.AAC.1